MSDFQKTGLEPVMNFGASFSPHPRPLSHKGRGEQSEATESSDMDLLVDFKPGYRLFDQIGLEQELENLLGHRVDVNVEGNLREEFRDSILRDATPLCPLSSNDVE